MNTSHGPVHIEIVLDFVCAHSYLGFTRLKALADELRSTGTEVAIVFSPHRLRPEAPEHPEPLFEVHRRDRGEEFAQRIAADRTVGAEDGLILRFDKALFGNTRSAHRLTALAARYELAEPMTERLFRAYFSEGRDIADPHTLGALAEDVGVDAHQPWPGITGLLHGNRAAGVTKTPVFRLADGTVLHGERTRVELRRALVPRSRAPESPVRE